MEESSLRSDDLTSEKGGCATERRTQSTNRNGGGMSGKVRVLFLIKKRK